jgi:hypothetical protein
MVFNVKKLLNVGVDLKLQQRGKKKWPRWNGQQIFGDLGHRYPAFAGERVDAGVYQVLLRRILVSWIWRIYPGKKYAFRYIQHQPAPLKPPSSCWQNSNFWRNLAIFARLEFAGLLYLMCFACESPGYRSLKFGLHTSVHRCGIGLASRGIYPQNMRLIQLPPLSRC